MSFNFIKPTGILNFCVRVIVGSMVLVIIAHFVPELKDKVPSLYNFADLVLSIFNKVIGLLPFI